MKYLLRPKNDIVLSSGVFLTRGRVVEVDITEQEFTSIAPDVYIVRPQEDKVDNNTPPQKKRGKKSVKDELDG